MSTPVAPLMQRPAWTLLQAHHQAIVPLHLRKLFAEDPDRGERLMLEAAGIYLDYSKNRITPETLPLLVELAEQSGLRERIDAMFGGQVINVSENRSVLHTALRAPREGGGHECVVFDTAPQAVEALTREQARKLIVDLEGKPK